MSENRNSREADTRETAARPKSWAPPSILPEINHEEGYAYRYVRVSTMGTPDVNNVSSKFREGWEPVKASDHPEAFTMADPNSRFKDGIETGGLLLCKMPEEFANQRTAYYRDKTEDTALDDEVDEKYEEAIQLVMETRRASISMLQRRLRVGYNRAARMIEMMEHQGLVSGSDGIKPREVLPPE